MKYIEVTFTMADTDVFRDLLVDTLGNEGPYESFVETPDGLKAYVPVDSFDEGWLKQQLQDLSDQFSIFNFQFSIREMEDRDWNAEWEAKHEAVLVNYDGGAVWVRAPFHPHRTDVDYELIIEPKMSFGTAHHPTTYMMLSYVAELPMVGRRVLDMGCGTGVLGILAKMRDASYVEGIDVDEWAYANAQENAAANGVEVNFRLGDANLLTANCDPLTAFDIVIANINRNILLTDMDKYAAVLNPGGTLLLSGFYDADDNSLITKANTLGMTLKSKKSRDGWSALQLNTEH